LCLCGKKAFAKQKEKELTTKDSDSTNLIVGQIGNYFYEIILYDVRSNFLVVKESFSPAKFNSQILT